MELTLQDALQKGMTAHKAGRLEEAKTLYRAILNSQPKHPDANHNLGVIIATEGNPEQALDLFKQSIDANPRLEQFWVSYTRTLLHLNRIDSAKKAIKKAIKNGISSGVFNQFEKIIQTQNSKKTMVENQEPPPVQLQLIMQCYERGEFQQTIFQVDQLLKTFPTSSILLNIQGESYAQLGQFDLAIEIYNKLVSANPSDADRLFNLGLAFQKKGDITQAIENYAEAIKNRPNHAQAYCNMSAAQKTKGNVNDAINSIKRALQIDPALAKAHNNLGNLQRTKNDFDGAIASYKKAVAIQPNYVEAYFNLGNAQKDSGYSDDAIINFKHAIRLKPNFEEAHFNAGYVFQSQGNLVKALIHYRQAIKIRTDYDAAYNNMGIVHHEIGDIKAALKCGSSAIELNPNNRQAWYNYFYSLRTVQPPNAPFIKALPTSLQRSELQSSKIELSLLEYKLNLGKSAAEASMNKAMTLLGLAKNTRINNPKAPIEVSLIERKLPEKVVALLHFGRSGTGLLHSLIDGHSKISTLPSIYFSEFFDVATWKKLIMNGWEGIPDQFIAMYPVLFDARASDPIHSIGHKTIANIGRKEGMANVGVNRDEALSIDEVMFKQELWRLMCHYNELDAAIFFQLAHGAYEKAIGNTDDKDILFYHIHNPDTYAKLNFMHLAPNASWVMMVREPIQSLESWIRKPFFENDYKRIVMQIITILLQVDDPIFRCRNAIGVRLEDLKKSPKKTLRALCHWLGVKEEESLYKMTAQGKMWWGDPSSPDYGKEAMTPFGVNSIERKVGSIFSDNDQFVLRTLFYPFNVKFGYVDENSEQFKSDIREIRPMLDQIFDFEKVIIAETGVDEKQFTRSGSYRYLRSCMLERWDTLNELDTYPHLLQPLLIDKFMHCR